MARCNIARALCRLDSLPLIEWMALDPNVPHFESVLIVDDSAVQRSLGAALCRECGIVSVYEAGNGKEALAVLEGLPRPPALLIIDLEMPAMDGLELLGCLRERCVRVPIIVASSRERALIESVRELGSALGLSILGTLQKPLSDAALRDLLRQEPAPATETRSVIGDDRVSAEELQLGMDRGEIVVHYQPQVEVETGYVRGLEALARWQHPTRGMIAPDRFIAVAEQHGLIHRLTLQVMDQALSQLAEWHRRGFDLSIAINMSPKLLDVVDLVEEVSDRQARYGIPAGRVILELTESSLPHERATALAVLTRLRLRGYGLSLDDYGTGFSSLRQLAQIPFTELKIDRAFVHGAHERENLKTILCSALELAQNLKIATVAEGVESLRDWTLLRERGCTFAQGWLLAKALPASEFGSWLKRHLARRSELIAGPDDTIPIKTLEASAREGGGKAHGARSHSARDRNPTRLSRSSRTRRR